MYTWVRIPVMLLLARLILTDSEQRFGNVQVCDHRSMFVCAFLA